MDAMHLWNCCWWNNHHVIAIPENAICTSPSWLNLPFSLNALLAGWWFRNQNWVLLPALRWCNFHVSVKRRARSAILQKALGWTVSLTFLPDLQRRMDDFQSLKSGLHETALTFWVQYQAVALTKPGESGSPSYPSLKCIYHRLSCAVRKCRSWRFCIKSPESLITWPPRKTKAPNEA